MLAIQQITRQSRQKMTLILPDGSQIQMEIYFMPLQQGWFIVKMIYGDFVLQNIRITVSPNMLHQFKNQIPFGLACFSPDNREPTLQDDFLTGAASLYVLTADEVNQYAETLSGV